MSNHIAILKYSICVLLCLIATILLSAFWLRDTTRGVIAQENILNIRSLLESVSQRASDDEKEIFIRFSVPLSGEESEWIIPTIDTEGGYVTRTIHEIGEDYVCIDERLSEIVMTRCTPFSNIVSISYISTP